MKKLTCMIALAAISFGTVFAATPVRHTGAIQMDTTKMKKKKMKMKHSKMKMKKDTTKM